MYVFGCRYSNPERKESKMLKTKNIVIAAASLLVLSSWVVRPLIMAAEGEPQREKTKISPEEVRQAGMDRMQPGRMDPEAMHKMMLGRMKTELAATDQEWVAIEPLLEKVMTLSNEVNPRGMGMMAGRHERFAEQYGQCDDQTKSREDRYGRRIGQAEPSELQKAAAALREVLQKADPAPEEISASLAAFRTAKEAAQKELAAEQDKLREVVNARQEAKLVLMGMLN